VSEALRTLRIIDGPFAGGLLLDAIFRVEGTVVIAGRCIAVKMPAQFVLADGRPEAANGAAVAEDHDRPESAVGAHGDPAHGVVDRAGAKEHGFAARTDEVVRGVGSPSEKGGAQGGFLVTPASLAQSIEPVRDLVRRRRRWWRRCWRRLMRLAGAL